MGHDDASVILLTCTDDPATAGVPAGAIAVPARPGRADVDPLLAGPVRRLVVTGTDADLAAVLVRLMRRDRLDVELAYVPADRRSAVARRWGLPHGAAAVDLARDGVAQPAPLVRDDSGGVLVGRGEIGPLRGEAYCDGQLVLRGSARRLVVTPWPDAAPVPPRPNGSEPNNPGLFGSEPISATGLLEPAPPGLAVRVGRWGTLPDGRERPVPPTARTGRGAGVGRAVQIGCLPATVVHDGVAHPRPVTRWAWYRHVADWLLVRP